MPRHFAEPKLVIASHNPGKVREIAALLENFECEIISAGDLGLDEPIEPGTTFAANAELKARAAAQSAGLAALADDSGLAVTALGGEPGILSARWAGPDKDFTIAMQKVEDRLAEENDRSAHFVCALALCWPDGHMETFEGRVDGTLIWPPKGDKGFGYDPLFYLPELGKTMAELPFDEKNRISHRGRAAMKVVEELKERKWHW